MNTARYREVTAGHKGGERLVLTLIAMRGEEGEAADVDSLVEDSGLSAKQVLRIASKLKEDGAINVEGGTGRAPYVFTLASANQDKMSSQANGDKTSAQDIKSSQDGRSEDKMSPLADAGTKCPDKAEGSEDILSGTPLAPSEDIRTSTDTPQPSVEGDADAPPSSRKTSKVIPHPSAKPESDHQRLMRELYAQTGPIPDGKAQGDAVNWLLKNYSVDDCLACLSEFLAELKDSSHWRTSRVSWLTVRKEIGTWKLKGTDDEQAAPNRPARTQYGGRPPVTRDYSKFGSRT